MCLPRTADLRVFGILTLTELLKRKQSFLLCYSVLSPSSFYSAESKWLSEIKHHSPRTPILLVGLKTDMRAEYASRISLITPRQGAELSKTETMAGFAECSALTQEGLKKVFDQSASTILGEEKIQHSKLYSAND